MVDRRIRKTKKEIENALMELVEQQDFEQISVTDIADKADISRRTFYQHYVDKYDLLAKLEEGLVKDYLVILGNIDLEEISIDKQDNMVLIFDFINQNRHLIKMIMKIRNPALIQELLKQSRNFLLKNKSVQNLFGNHFDQELAEYALAFIFGGFAEIMQRWVKSDFAMSSDKLIELMHRFIVGTYEVMDPNLLKTQSDEKQ